MVTWDTPGNGLGVRRMGVGMRGRTLPGVSAVAFAYLGGSALGDHSPWIQVLPRGPSERT